MLGRSCMVRLHEMYVAKIQETRPIEGIDRNNEDREIKLQFMNTLGWFIASFLIAVFIGATQSSNFWKQLLVFLGLTFIYGAGFVSIFLCKPRLILIYSALFIIFELLLAAILRTVLPAKNSLAVIPFGIVFLKFCLDIHRAVSWHLIKKKYNIHAWNN